MAIQSGDRVNFVCVNGTNLPAVPDDATIYFIKGAKCLYVGQNLVANASKQILWSNSGSHNSIYRGQNLGAQVTTAQYDAISDGTFDDMYIGDYWQIDGVNWRIAAFDYYMGVGMNGSSVSPRVSAHHVTIVPDTSLYTCAMNTGGGVVGAYAGSELYTSGLAQAKSQIYAAFGEAHILTHSQYFNNAVTDGHPSGVAEYASTVDLMSEINVYGSKIFAPMSTGSTLYRQLTYDKSQYPLFFYQPRYIRASVSCWLRDVVTSAYFAMVNKNGNSSYGTPSTAYGVRPAFSIIK